MSPRNSFLSAALLSSLLAGNGILAFAPVAPARSSSSSLKMMDSSSSPDRRNFLNNFGTLAAGAIFVGVAGVNDANALDFDAFEKAEIASDTKNCDPKRDPKCQPKLSDDEALCQYGSGGQARGEACQRVRKAKEAAAAGKK
mmetsp:Transcript_24388/g.51444  ORF Transcript_24388/g.51444 Transcript_24388/m.51444 type:complete len:142 (+) Transcript_24388:130-555(+)